MSDKNIFQLMLLKLEHVILISLSILELAKIESIV